MKQTTYMMVKPGFANDVEIVDAIVKRVREAGLKIEEASYVKYDTATASEHYAQHLGKSFFPKLIDYITSEKAFGMVVSGENAISVVRALSGPTTDAPKGTIRGDFGFGDITKNVVHSSDSEASSAREIEIYEKAKKRFVKHSTLTQDGMGK